MEDTKAAEAMRVPVSLVNHNMGTNEYREDNRERGQERAGRGVE